MRFALFTTACLLAAPAFGQGAAPAAVPPPPDLQALQAQAAAAPGSAASAPARAAPAARGAVPAHVAVIEDDGVRIEESRVRGQTRRILVHSKVEGVPGAVRSYEIIVAPGGHDPSRDRGGALGGNTGQRAWSLLNF